MKNRKRRPLHPASAPLAPKGSVSPSRTTGRTRAISSGAGAAIFLFAILAYLPSLRAGFVWDDEAITENPVLLDSAGLKAIWTRPLANTQEEHYWPLVYTTFWIEHKLWGFDPLGYHAVNLLLHGVNALLLLMLLRRMRLPGAWLAAAVFALHPVHVESVTWIVERKDVLSGLFYLAAFLAYMRFEDRGSRRFYAASLALFALALLSKSIVVSLPVAIALWLWWKGDSLKWRSYLPLAPFCLVAIVLTLFDFYWVRQHAGYPTGFTFMQRVLTAARALGFYAEKLLWPVNLMIQYPKWELNALSLWTYIFPLTLAGAALAMLRLETREFGKGLLACGLFFAITLLPTLGFVDFGFLRYAYVADRFQYLASIGVIVIFSAIATRYMDRLPPARRWVGWGATGALLAFLGLLTWQRSALYKDRETLLADNLRKNPESWLAWQEVANAHSARGESEIAIAYYQRAIELNPDYREAHNNLGYVWLMHGKYEDAAREFAEAIRIEPRYPDALNNLGAALTKQGKIAEALAYYSKALDVDPNCTMARNNVERIESRAEREFAGDPGEGGRSGIWDSAEALNNLAATMLRQGKLDQAVRYLSRAIEVKPDHAHAMNNLGIALYRLGRRDEAIRNFTHARELDPGFNEVNVNLQRALALNISAR